jgi:hypothetical protein
MIKPLLAASAALVLSLAVTSSAHAQTGSSGRTFLSGTGTNSGICTVTAPCRSLDYAITQTAPKGEIVLLDTAGYGPVTITAAVSIISEGHPSFISVPPGGNGIFINAGANDSVLLRGLTIDGLGTGANGILFFSGGALTIDKCNVLNLAGNGQGAGYGISMAGSTSKITISDTSSSNNAYAGIFLFGTSSARVEMDHVVTNNNQYGISLSGGATALFNVTNSIASNNTQNGFGFDGPGPVPPAATSLDSLIAIGNGNIGVFLGHGTMYLGRSVISSNGAGVFIASGGVATGFSYQNNQINANGTDVIGTLSNTTFK